MTPEQLAAGQAWAADRRRRTRLINGDRDRWAAHSLTHVETDLENQQIQRGGNR